MAVLHVDVQPVAALHLLHADYGPLVLPQFHHRVTPRPLSPPPVARGGAPGPACAAGPATAVAGRTRSAARPAARGPGAPRCGRAGPIPPPALPPATGPAGPRAAAARPAP